MQGPLLIVVGTVYGHFTKLVRDVGVNVIANIIAGSLGYIIGAATGLLTAIPSLIMAAALVLGGACATVMAVAVSRTIGDPILPGFDSWYRDPRPPYPALMPLVQRSKRWRRLEAAAKCLHLLLPVMVLIPPVGVLILAKQTRQEGPELPFFLVVGCLVSAMMTFIAYISSIIDSQVDAETGKTRRSRRRASREPRIIRRQRLPRQGSDGS